MLPENADSVVFPRPLSTVQEQLRAAGAEVDGTRFSLPNRARRRTSAARGTLTAVGDSTHVQVELNPSRASRRFRRAAYLAGLPTIALLLGILAWQVGWAFLLMLPLIVPVLLVAVWADGSAMADGLEQRQAALESLRVLADAGHAEGAMDVSAEPPTATGVRPPTRQRREA